MQLNIVYLHSLQKHGMAHRDIANKKEIFMSAEQAKSLIERIKSDIIFKVRLISIDNVEEKLKFIHSEGYLCTEAEIKDAEIEAHSSLGVQRGGYWFAYSFYTRHHL